MEVVDVLPLSPSLSLGEKREPYDSTNTDRHYGSRRRGVEVGLLRRLPVSSTLGPLHFSLETVGQTSYWTVLKTRHSTVYRNSESNQTQLWKITNIVVVGFLQKPSDPE